MILLMIKKILKSKLRIYRSNFISTLTYSHELWVVNKRMKSQVQAAEISSLHREAGLSLRDRVRPIAPPRREEPNEAAQASLG